MKNLVSGACGLIVAGAFLCVPVACSLAADSDTAATTNAPPKAAVATISESDSTPATDTVRARLPSGVADVVKLSRAKVSDDVVLGFVQNSGTAYSLTADDIVQMRKEGVSDRVINAMLDQHTKAAETAQHAAVAPAPVPAETSETPAAAPATESASASEKPVVEAPLTPTASSATVAPYPADAYYGYYGPYYYPYYYGGPVIAFGFGYGGCYYGHGHGIHGVGGIHGGHR